MGQSIGGGLYGMFKVKLEALIVDNYDALVNVVAPLAESFVFLYVVIIGYNALKGNLGQWTQSSLRSMFILVVVYSLIFETNGYINWLYHPLMSAIDGLMKVVIVVVGGADAGAFNSSIDTAFSSVFKNIEAVGNASDSWSLGNKIKTFFAVLILLIVYGLNYILYFGLVIIATISLHIQLVMGVFILFLAAFGGTRFIFYSWLKDMLTYALWPVYAAIVMSITLYFFKGSTKDLALLDLSTGDVFSAPYAISVLVGAFGMWALFKCPQYAASLTSGTAGSTGGIAGGIVGGLAGGATGAAATAAFLNKGTGADGKSYSRIGSAASALKSGASNATSAIGGYIKGRKMEGY